MANSSNPSNSEVQSVPIDSQATPATKIQKERQCRERFRCLSIAIVAIIAVLYLLQYQEMLFPHKETAITQDLYEILEVEPTASRLDIKKNYKLLMKDFFPDKYRNCEACQQRFLRISQAFHVISDPITKEEYDRSRIPIIRSSTKTITAGNFQRLVGSCCDFWVLQVYKDGDKSCLEFSSSWEQAAIELSDLVKFGRINAEKETQLLSSLPVKVTSYPSIFTINLREITLFSINNFSDPSELIGSIKEEVSNAIQLVERVNLDEALSTEASAVAISFIDKSDMSCAYKVFAFRYRFDFKLLQGRIENVNTERMQLNIAENVTLAVFYRHQDGLNSLIFTEKLTNNLMEIIFLKIQRQSWPAAYSNNYYELCDGTASFCLITLIDPDTSLLQFSRIANNYYQFARISPDLHSFPTELASPIILIRPDTGDYMPFEDSNAVLSFLKTYSPDKESNGWIPGTVFLHYQGFNSLNLLWNGLGAILLFYISYKFLF